MTEIRSTIDLMMERTRGLSLSNKEKDELRREEFVKRAKGLALKIMDGTVDADQVLSDLADENPEDRRLLEKLLWSELAGSLEPEQNTSRIVNVLAALPQAAKKEDIIREVRELTKTGSKAGVKDRKKLMNRERKRLAAFGISGSAVIPKVSAESESKSALSRSFSQLSEKLLR